MQCALNTHTLAHSRARASRGTCRETLEFRRGRRVCVVGSIRRKEGHPVQSQQRGGGRQGGGGGILEEGKQRIDGTVRMQRRRDSAVTPAAEFFFSAHSMSLVT